MILQVWAHLLKVFGAVAKVQAKIRGRTFNTTKELQDDLAQFDQICNCDVCLILAQFSSSLTCFVNFHINVWLLGTVQCLVVVACLMFLVLSPVGRQTRGSHETARSQRHSIAHLNFAPGTCHTATRRLWTRESWMTSSQETTSICHGVVAASLGTACTMAWHGCDGYRSAISRRGHHGGGGDRHQRCRPRSGDCCHGMTAGGVTTKVVGLPVGQLVG